MGLPGSNGNKQDLHLVMLDKYIHSKLVYYKHNGDDEPYD